MPGQHSDKAVEDNVGVCGRQANEVGFTLSWVAFTGRRRTQRVLVDVSILHDSGM